MKVDYVIVVMDEIMESRKQDWGGKDKSNWDCVCRWEHDKMQEQLKILDRSTV